MSGCPVGSRVDSGDGLRLDSLFGVCGPACRDDRVYLVVLGREGRFRLG